MLWPTRGGTASRPFDSLSRKQEEPPEVLLYKLKNVTRESWKGRGHMVRAGALSGGREGARVGSGRPEILAPKLTLELEA